MVLPPVHVKIASNILQMPQYKQYTLNHSPLNIVKVLIVAYLVVFHCLMIPVGCHPHLYLLLLTE